jgi:hypothetical protein
MAVPSPRLPFRSGPPQAQGAGPGTVRIGRPAKAEVRTRRRRTGLPGSWGTPAHLCRVLRPRRDPTPLALAVCRAWPPLWQRRRLSAGKALSGLDSTASALAVYASPPGSPPQGARLASGGWLDLTGWDWLPTGSRRKVSVMHSVHRFPLPQASPGAMPPCQLSPPRWQDTPPAPSSAVSGASVVQRRCPCPIAAEPQPKKDEPQRHRGHREEPSGTAELRPRESQHSTGHLPR